MPGDWSNEFKIRTLKNKSEAFSYYKNSTSSILTKYLNNNVAIFDSNIFEKPINYSCEYTVKPNDSLWRISYQYYGVGIKYSNIIDENNLTSTVIQIGQKLKIGCKYQ
jgi:LysM repeat protein